MPVKPIVKLPHSVLRKTAAEVPIAEIASRRIQRLISDMKEALTQAPDGVGLAAPQVGESLRMFLVSEEALMIDVQAKGTNGTKETKGTKEWKYFVFINPVLKKRSREKSAVAEGCLSVPGKVGEVPRSEKVYLEWHDERGKKHGRGFTKFFARVIQHEMDHLDGILISDRAKKLIGVSSDRLE